MGRVFAIVAGILGLLGLVVVVAFVAQNSLRTTQLSLNLVVAAWELKEPMPVIGLLGGAFGLGLVLAGTFFTWLNWGLKAEVRALKRQLAVSDVGGF